MIHKITIRPNTGIGRYNRALDHFLKRLAYEFEIEDEYINASFRVLPKPVTEVTKYMLFDTFPEIYSVLENERSLPEINLEEFISELIAIHDYGYFLFSQDYFPLPIVSPMYNLENYRNLESILEGRNIKGKLFRILDETKSTTALLFLSTLLLKFLHPIGGTQEFDSLFQEIFYTFLITNASYAYSRISLEIYYYPKKIRFKKRMTAEDLIRIVDESDITVLFNPYNFFIYGEVEEAYNKNVERFLFISFVLGPAHPQVLEYAKRNLGESLPISYFPYLHFAYMTGRNIPLYLFRERYGEKAWEEYVNKSIVDVLLKLSYPMVPGISKSTLLEKIIREGELGLQDIHQWLYNPMYKDIFWDFLRPN